MNDLSQAFTSALFFRILLPGFVFAIGLHPLLMTASGQAGISGTYPGGAGALFLAETAAFGLLAYAASTPIYHIAQGLVLPWLTAPARVVNRWRLNRKYKQFTKEYGTKSYSEVDPETAKRLQQLFVYLSDFPIEIDEGGEPRFILRHSTRVGNITATYERYPDTRYGINAEAFWEHFLFLVPSDIRKELDGVQAVAIGTLLSSAAAWIVFLVGAAIGIARVAHAGTGWSLGAAPLADGSLPLMITYALAAATLFNYLARTVHREYGRMFRACFDVHVTSFSTWLRSHRAPLSRSDIDIAEGFRIYASALANVESSAALKRSN